MSSLITATIGRTRGATRAQQGAAIEGVWAERGEVTTSGSKFEVVEIEKHAARGTKRCVSPRSFDCTHGTQVWLTTAPGTHVSVTSTR